MRSTRALSALILIGLAACSSSGSSAPASTTSAPVTTAATTASTTSPSSTTTATAATTASTSTAPAVACPTIAPNPTAKGEPATTNVDVDGDGKNDSIRIYTNSNSGDPDSWRILIELASGGGVDEALQTNVEAFIVPKFLGAAYVGKKSGPKVLFIQDEVPPKSASVSLFQVRDCKFTFVKEPDTGVPTGFYVSDKYGAYCMDNGDSQQLVEVITGPKTADGKWPTKVLSNDVVNGELTLHSPAVDTVETAISAHVGILDCQGIIAPTPGA